MSLYNGDWFFFGNDVGLWEWLEFDVVVVMGDVGVCKYVLGVSEPLLRRGVRVANNRASPYEKDEPCNDKDGYENE